MNNFLAPKGLVSLLVFFMVCSVAFAQTATPKGKIAGKVIDRKSGETLIGVAVKVEELSKGAVTDLDGKYVISVETGTYTIAVSYLGYETQKFSGVVVSAGQVANVDVALSESKSAASTKEVTITTVVKKGSVDLLLLDQKTANGVTSGISSELIKRTPDRTAADVLKRISGTSIQDNKFAIVRGLGDRYNSGMINGAPVPSTEPDRKAFNLELVPAPMIESIVISKSATPDQPGDFGGGLVQINTKDIPFSNSYYMQVGGGANSITTGNTYYQGTTSGTDWLGYDNGLRKLPSNLLNKEFTDNYSQTHGTSFSKNSAFLDNTRLFKNDFSANRTDAAPNTSFQFGTGLRIPLGKDDLGIVAAVSYAKNLRYSPISSQAYDGVASTDSARKTQDKAIYNFSNYKTTVNLGIVFNLSYKLGDATKFTFKNFLSQSSEDVTSIVNGYQNKNYDGATNYYADSVVTKNRIFFYSSNRLYSSQMSGEHLFPKTKIKIKVTGSLNNLYRTTPDFRKLLYTYSYQFGDKFYRFNDKESGIKLNQGEDSPNITTTSNKYFSDMNENGGSVNYFVEVPYTFLSNKQMLKVGGLWQQRQRTYSGRNFIYSIDKDFNPTDLYTYNRTSPDLIFAESSGKVVNIDTNRIFLKEGTRDYDDYNAGTSTRSYFVMSDNRFGKAHLVWGARIESFNMKLNSSNNGKPVRVNTLVTDVLPSANLTIEITPKLNLRASVANTVSRPEFREISPLVFFDVNYNSISLGNPDLKRTLISNYDIKLEYYPTDGETFSINPFYKAFLNPIEQFNEVAGGYRRLSYVNATSAANLGLELEARVNLGRISDKLSDLTVYGNYAWIKSTVDLTDSIGKALSVDGSRPLQGQSPYIFNAGIQYSNQKSGINALLSFNRIGRRIVFVARGSQDFIWENPRTIVDFSIGKTFFKKLQARLVIGDILHQNMVFYQDIDNSGDMTDSDVRAFTFRYGTSTSISINYTF